MNVLGEGHFDTRIESLPAETVLWEGGASRHAIWLLPARFGVFLLFVAFAYAAFFMPLLLALPSPDTSAMAAAPASDGGPPATTETRDAREARRREAASGVWRGAAWALFSIAAVVVWLVSSAALFVRNAWFVVTSERICIQTGAWTKSLSVIDLDKILSIEVSSSYLQRRSGLINVQFVHAGREAGKTCTMAYLPAGDAAIGNILNNWLPRDNRARRALHDGRE